MIIFVTGIETWKLVKKVTGWFAETEGLSGKWGFELEAGSLCYCEDADEEGANEGTSDEEPKAKAKTCQPT